MDDMAVSGRSESDVVGLREADVPGRAEEGGRAMAQVPSTTGEGRRAGGGRKGRDAGGAGGSRSWDVTQAKANRERAWREEGWYRMRC